MSKRRRARSTNPKRGAPRAPAVRTQAGVQSASFGGTRRSRRIIRHVDTGSVLKFSAVFYLTLACIAFVAGVVLWLAATTVGVRGNVERFIGELIASKKFHFVGWEVLRVSAVFAVVMVILGTALNLFLAVVYNLIAVIVGGMAIIVDEEQGAPVAGTIIPAAARPASEIAAITPGARSPGSGSSPGTKAAATAAGPEAGAEDTRPVARWLPKQGRQV